MNRLWRCGTALVGAGLAAGAGVKSGAAESPITLSVGGFFREAYMVVLDDDGFLEPGDNRAEDGFFNDAEIHFNGRTVLDNGLEVGARVELEGETDGGFGGDQIDEAWVYFAGGWGEIRVGSDDDALAGACLLPPGGTANFSAFSPNQWGANAFSPVTNSACTGVDDAADAQKILYISPVFGGFQLTLSYTPDPQSETHLDGVGPHLGMTPKFAGSGVSNYDAAAYLTYSYRTRDWGLNWGGGVSFEGEIDDVEDAFTDTRFKNRDFYQTALNLEFGRFSVGGVFAYYNDIDGDEVSFAGLEFEDEHDAWVAGGGVAFLYNAWTFGAQYSYREDIFKLNAAGDSDREEQVQQRAVVTVDYVLGPGISLDGEVAYTWRDFDPEDESLATDDDYDGVEFGIGTALRF